MGEIAGQAEVSPAVERADGTRVVRVDGEVDMGNVALVEAALRDALADAARGLIDLAGVAYIDSAGLAALDRLVRDAGIRGAALHVRVAPGGPVDRILRIAGLDALIGA